MVTTTGRHKLRPDRPPSVNMLTISNRNRNTSKDLSSKLV